MNKNVKFPGPKSARMLQELRRYVLADPHPFVLNLARCHGMWLVTQDGDEIFDWAGYYGAKLLGHNHPRLAEPEYLRHLALAANNKISNPDFLTPECLAYYRVLHENAPRCMSRDAVEVYTVNSGAEAVENMMKYLINLHRQKLLAANKTVKTHRFIYFDQAFHGRTVFALNVTRIQSSPLITRDFHGLLAGGNIEVTFPALHGEQSSEFNASRLRESLAAVERALKNYGDEIVGIIVEPIQGAGGHRMADPAFFRGLSQLCQQYGVYLGFDEVQTAGGQTGTFFAIDQFDLPYPPQAVAGGKKLGNGVVYMLQSMSDLGVLDSTWGGTLADMVRFVREMEVVQEEHLLEQVATKAAHLIAGLRQLEQEFSDLIFNVRGMGLYQGFTLREPQRRKNLTEIALQQENLLLLGAGRQSIRLRPALDVTVAEIDLMLTKLCAALQRLSQ